MKALLVLTLAALTSAGEVRLREGITPKKLPAVQLSVADIPETSWSHLQSLVLENGSPGLKGGYIEADVTEYSLKVLANIQSLIIHQGLDPMELESQTIKLFPVGTLTLSSGWLQGLSAITLSDNVTARYSLSTSILELTLPLDFDSLLFTYDYRVKIILLSISGGITAKLSDFKLNLHMGFDFSQYKAFVDEADIRDSGTITIKFTGLGLLDWIIDLMTGVTTTLFHGIILSVVNLFIYSPVNSLVDTINNAIDSFLHPNSTTFF